MRLNCASLWLRSSAFHFPLLDIPLQVPHLLANGFAPGFELFERVRSEKLDQLLLLRDFIVQLDDLGMLWPQNNVETSKKKPNRLPRGQTERTIRLIKITCSSQKDRPAKGGATALPSRPQIDANLALG